MNAVEFVKKFGISKAKGITFVMVDGIVNYDGFSVNLNDLKQIIDAFELVESLGGMDMAKDIFDIEIHEPHYNYDAEKVTRIEQAINLVEQCQND